MFKLSARREREMERDAPAGMLKMLWTSVYGPFTSHPHFHVDRSLPVCLNRADY